MCGECVVIVVQDPEFHASVASAVGELQKAHTTEGELVPGLVPELVPVRVRSVECKAGHKRHVLWLSDAAKQENAE